MPLQIFRQDIAKTQSDAIVNSTSELGHIFSGAEARLFAVGGESLAQARIKLGLISTGHSVYSSAFGLHAKYVIHTVPPVWEEELHNVSLLEQCYESSLELAKDLGCSSIAFPLIGAGSRSFPKAFALSIALRVIKNYLQQEDMDIIIAVYEDEAYLAAKSRYGDIESRFTSSDFLRLSYSYDSRMIPMRSSNTEVKELVFYDVIPHHRSLEEQLKNQGDSFQTLLFRWIIQKGLSDPMVYRQANMDKKLFSKIRNQGYKPKKYTALSLCVALELTQIQTNELLATLGYTLTNSDPVDLIVTYYMERRIYDIHRINITLFDYELPLLGSI